MTSLHLFNTLQRCADEGRIFLATNNTDVGYSELVSAVTTISTWFDSVSMATPDRVAISTPDAFAFSATTIAAIVTGITPVIIPSDLPRDLALKRARKFGCRYILLPQLSKEGHAFVSLLQGNFIARLTRQEKAVDFIKVCSTKNEAFSPLSVNPETASSVVFSSGTTGQPKGVRWSHGALFHHLETYRKALGYRVSEQLVNALPLHHTDGYFHGPLMTAWTGMTWVRPPQFSFDRLEDWQALMKRRNADVLVSVPSMLAMIRNLKESPLNEQMACLRLIVSSAEALPADLYQEIEQAVAPVANIYGMTETVNGGLFRLPGSKASIYSVGHPIDMDACIVDDEHRECPTGTEGHLALKGQSLCDGYEFGSDFTPLPKSNGWFITADLAKKEAEGSYIITGRADEAINVNGILIHPSQIDTALTDCSLVAESKTLMLTSIDMQKDVPVCFVKTNSNATTAQVQEFLKERLALHLIPRRIIPVDEIPRTSTGKVDRNALKAILLEVEQKPHANQQEGDIADRVMALACRVLDLDPRNVTISMRQDDIIGWDSFGHINLALELERDFELRFSYAEVTSIETIGDFVKFIQERSSQCILE